MSQPCNCGEDECNGVCWRDKCLDEFAARYTRMPSGDYFWNVPVIKKDGKGDE